MFQVLMVYIPAYTFRDEMDAMQPIYEVWLCCVIIDKDM